MFFTKEHGITIDETVIKMLDSAVKREGSQNQLAVKLNVKPQNLQNWRGNGERKGYYILWDQWEKIKPYFVQNGDVSADDPQWMTPSEMRERIQSTIKGGAMDALSEEEKTLIQNYRLANEAGKIAIMATAQAQAAIAKRDASKPGEMAE